MRMFESVVGQTYAAWELIMVDDSTNLPLPTRRYIEEIVRPLDDPRVRYVDIKPRSGGNIGRAKRRGFMLGEGELLVELDHDDVLLPNCVERLVEAVKMYPTAGMYYSDCAEILPDGSSNKYPEGWGWGFGTETYLQDKDLWHIDCCPINAKTIRYITSCPNHVRAFRAQPYRAVGGHRADLSIADDYELMVKMFCNFDLVHIPELLYLQYIQENSQQRVRNGLIHEMVPEISNWYNPYIHERVLALGGEDWIWDNGWESPLPAEIKNLAHVFRS